MIVAGVGGGGWGSEILTLDPPLNYVNCDNENKHFEQNRVLKKFIWLNLLGTLTCY